MEMPNLFIGCLITTISEIKLTIKTKNDASNPIALFVEKSPLEVTVTLTVSELLTLSEFSTVRINS